jgi:hypothetical protein
VENKNKTITMEKLEKMVNGMIQKIYKIMFTKGI